jgi:ATP-dependent Clp protease ATP-binding subunit ClpC
MNGFLGVGAWLRRSGGDPKRARPLALAQALPEAARALPPAELLAHDGFRKGVRLLEGRAYTTTDLLADYASGETMLACMALAALAEREADRDLLEPIAAGLARPDDRVRWFALRVLDREGAGRTVSRVLAATDRSWREPTARAALVEFVRKRLARGDAVDGDAFEALPHDQQEWLDGVLAEARGAPQRAHANVAALRPLGRVLDAQTLARALPQPALEQRVREITARLSRQRPRPLLLVGPAGAGRTTTRREVARALLERGWLVVDAGLAELDVAGQLERRLDRLLRGLAGNARTLWISDDLPAMLSRPATADLLLPALEQSDIAVLGEATEHEAAHLRTAAPRAHAAVDRLEVEPLDEAATLVLARAWSAAHGGAHSGIDESTLTEALATIERPLGHRALPGRLLDCLRAAAELGAGARPLGTDDVLAAVQKLTGLPPVFVDERARLDLDELAERLGARVPGQRDAVSCLVEHAAMIKARLTAADRPQAVLLLTGPDAAGKRACAQALAGILFGATERVATTDLAGGESAWSALVHRLRAQPHCVVALEDVDCAPAHARERLASALAEGRMTAGAASADLRQCVVLLTAAGPVAVAGCDRIIAFQPSGRAAQRALQTRELDAVLQRQGLRARRHAIEWDGSALDLLLGSTGAIERLALPPLARALVEHPAPGPSFFLVHARDGALAVDLIDPRNAGTAAELETLRARLTELRDIAGSESWQRARAAAAPPLSDYHERIADGLRSAERLLARVDTDNPEPRAACVFPRCVAMELHLVRAAIDSVVNERTHGAWLSIESSRLPPTHAAATAEFAARLARMYRRWARARRMQLDVLEETRGDRRFACVLAVSGFGAFTLLEREAGIHALEAADGRRSSIRLRVRVSVAARAEPDRRPPLEAARRALAAARAEQPPLVRRYQEAPPLIEDRARGWRTEDWDAVLDGGFDLPA